MPFELTGLLAAALPLLVAITLHEAAHAFVAWRLGDDTAYVAGRVSFNPLRHIDPFGTILLPGLLLLANVPFLFGWAKPVPIQPHRLGNPRRDMVLVALAGPAANLFLALASAWLLHLMSLVNDGSLGLIEDILRTSIWVNVLLAVFNMLPLPPLDGGRVAVGLLPVWAAIPLARMERAGLPLLLTLFMLPLLIGQFMNSSFSIFGVIVGQPALWLRSGIFSLFGLA